MNCNCARKYRFKCGKKFLKPSSTTTLEYYWMESSTCCNTQPNWTLKILSSSTKYMSDREAVLVSNAILSPCWLSSSVHVTSKVGQQHLLNPHEPFNLHRLKKLNYRRNPNFSTSNPTCVTCRLVSHEMGLRWKSYDSHWGKNPQFI